MARPRGEGGFMVQYQDIINKQDEIVTIVNKISTSDDIKEITQLDIQLEEDIKILKNLKISRIMEKQEKVS